MNWNLDNMDRAILHCDMNNFFASVECALNPSLKGKPIVVCGNEEERHGIVMACNYLAKEKGLKAAQPLWKARQLCKDLVEVNTPHYDEYVKYSKLFREICRKFTDRVEPFGIDECWLDVTNSMMLFGKPKDIADTIRKIVKEELDLTISAGVSFTKSFAKLGSDYKKPDATTVISKENYKNIVWPLPVEAMLGVGRSTKKVLNKYYIRTIGDLANEKVERLEYLLGKSGIMLYQNANGLDDSEVSIFEEIDEVKSISHGITTISDLYNNDDVWKLMLELSQEIAYKLRLKHLRACGVQVSIRNKELLWAQFQKKIVLSEQSAINIAKEAFELFKTRYDWKKPIRSVSIAVYKLIPEGTPEEPTFFDDINKKTKIENFEKCVEKINEKYGDSMVINASLMDDSNLPKTRKKVKYGIKK